MEDSVIMGYTATWQVPEKNKKHVIRILPFMYPSTGSWLSEKTNKQTTKKKNQVSMSAVETGLLLELLATNIAQAQGKAFLRGIGTVIEQDA